MYRHVFLRTNFSILTRNTEQTLAKRLPTRFYSSLRRPARRAGPRSRLAEPIRTTVKDTAPKAQATHINITPDERLSDDPTHAIVEIPSSPDSVLQPHSPGSQLVSQSALVVGREFEMLNIFLGFEQANRYKIMDPQGNIQGYIAEQDDLGKSISRQLLRTHRKMNATILNTQGEVVFKIVRPYSLVNSKIFIYTPEDALVGEVQQRWHLMKRKYDLFVGQNQFATIDTPFLGWDFNLQDEQGGMLGNVSRNFVGFAREIFTDTGEYVLRMDAVEGNSRGMTLDERAVTLACAISIDFDYFSRHSSHSSGGFMPFPMFGMGGGGGANEDQAPSADSGAGAGAGVGAGVGTGVGTGMGTDAGGYSTPPPPPPPQQDTNEYGDPWLTDEQAGVGSPDDNTSGFFDTLSDFFGDDN